MLPSHRTTNPPTGSSQDVRVLAVGMGELSSLTVRGKWLYAAMVDRPVLFRMHTTRPDAQPEYFVPPATGALQAAGLFVSTSADALYMTHPSANFVLKLDLPVIRVTAAETMFAPLSDEWVQWAVTIAAGADTTEWTEPLDVTVQCTHGTVACGTACAGCAAASCTMSFQPSADEQSQSVRYFPRHKVTSDSCTYTLDGAAVELSTSPVATSVTAGHIAALTVSGGSTVANGGSLTLTVTAEWALPTDITLQLDCDSGDSGSEVSIAALAADPSAALTFSAGSVSDRVVRCGLILRGAESTTARFRLEAPIVLTVGSPARAFNLEFSGGLQQTEVVAGSVGKEMWATLPPAAAPTQGELTLALHCARSSQPLGVARWRQNEAGLRKIVYMAPPHCGIDHCEWRVSGAADDIPHYALPLLFSIRVTAASRHSEKWRVKRLSGLSKPTPKLASANGLVIAPPSETQ